MVNPLHRGWVRPGWTVAIFLSSLLMLAGCADVRLNRFNAHADRNDYRWIADQEVGCRKADETCGRLHLIKGDACLRLARAAETATDRYACAADELARGLALVPSWPDPAERQRFQENLCEALQHLQDLQSGEDAEKTRVRFIKAAQALYQLAPESLPAIYYLASARLQQMQPELTDLNAARRVPVCSRLKRALNGVLSTMQSARQSDSRQWKRYATRYQRLSFDLGRAIRAAECYKMR
jgi:hypothetical protein